MPAEKFKILPTNVPGLDTILGGGIPVGSLIMLVGAPGTGKTILIQQLCFTWARNQLNKGDLKNSSLPEEADKPANQVGRKGRNQPNTKALYFSTLSEPHDKLIEHLSQFEFFDEKLLNSHIKYLSLTTVMEEGLSQTSDLIVENVRRERAGLVAIDGFRALEGLASNPDAIRRFLYRLSAQLSLLGATTVIALERNLDGSASEGDLTIADGILGLSSRIEGVREFNRIEVRKLRGMRRLRGLHPYEIDTSGFTTYPRLETLVQPHLEFPETDPTSLRLGFNLPELEKMLHGGLPLSSSTIIAGSPGVGKTLLGLHYLNEGLHQGETGLYVGFHESPQQLLNKATRFGLNLRQGVENEQIHLLTVSPVELEPDRVAQQIRQIVEKYKVQRVVFDGLAQLERACNLEQRVHDFIPALVNYFKEHSITALYIYEINKLVGPELDLGETPFTAMAENLLLLKQVEYKTRLHRIITLLKMRDSDYDNTICKVTIKDGQGITVLQALDSAEGLLTGVARNMEQK